MAASGADYGILAVTVAGAKGLKDGGEWRPYCKVTFEKQKVKTKASDDGSNPVWNANFKFDVTSSSGELQVSVWDKGTKTFLGHVKIRLSTLEAGKEHRQWFKLIPRQWKDKVKGSVELVVEYTAMDRGENRLSVDNFDLLKVLGKGSFGKVMLVQKKDTGCLYAMKTLNKEVIIARDEVEHTRAEQRVLGMVNHPFVVGLKFSFQSETKLYLILDYINGGELFQHLQNEVRFSPERCQFYTAELALALEYLHSLDIVYRDLKPENILIAHDGHIAITDFGLVKENMTEGETTSTFCGTAEYLAPEVLKGEGYGKEVDWWSLGILLYEMLSGLPPFYSENTNLMYKKILYSTIVFEDPALADPNVQDFIEKLLVRTPSARLGAGEGGADAIKSHPYFANISWTKLAARSVTPPWKPEVAGEADTSNFDETFTSMPAQDSVVEGSVLSDANQAAFDGFTYTEGSALSQA